MVGVDGLEGEEPVVASNAPTHPHRPNVDTKLSSARWNAPFVQQPSQAVRPS